MRARTTLFGALLCAAALVPAGTAVAGTGPAPSPDERRPASTAPSPAGNPLSAKAKAAGVCADAHEIGTVGYINRAGQRVASVKQFWSPECRENYGYLWIWDSFAAGGGEWDVTTAVYSASQDEVLGERRWTNRTDQEFWSNGTATGEDCTRGVGSVRLSGDPLSNQAASSQRC
jgi:hypothetical protein